MEILIEIVLFLASVGAGGALVVPVTNWIKNTFDLGGVKLGRFEVPHIIAIVITIVSAVAVELAASGVLEGGEVELHALALGIYLTSQVFYRSWKESEAQ